MSSFRVIYLSGATPSVPSALPAQVEIAGKATTSYTLDSAVHFSSITTSSTRAGLSVSAVWGVGCREFPDGLLGDLSLAVCLATADLTCGPE